MSRLPRIYRTDGRRKGYQHHRSLIGERLSPEVLEKLEALRGPVRKPQKSKPHHRKAAM